jgi:hypothetical protein
MFGKQKKVEEPVIEQPKEKPAPAYLREDYPYKAVGGALEVGEVEDGVVYEIWCDKCQMSIRSQGQNIRSQYERLKDSGCNGCGSKDLIIRLVDLSAAAEK